MKPFWTHYVRLLGWGEFLFNVLAVVAAWSLTRLCYQYGTEAAHKVGPLPLSFDDLEKVIFLPGAFTRFLSAGEVAILTAVGGVLLLSSIEGTWWLLKRLPVLARP